MNQSPVVLKAMSYLRSKRLFILFLLSLLFGIFLLQQPERSVKVAVSKGGRLFDVRDTLETVANQSAARNLTVNHPVVAGMLAGRDYGFLYAVPLTEMQNRIWSRYGCIEAECTHVTLYDYDRGGTIEAMLNQSTGDVFNILENRFARPGPSPYILPRALSITKEDPRVGELLGDIRDLEPLMVPMSAWLADDSCNEDWCVDLTFMAPDNSGRILHVMVNMHSEQVGRIFYTRGRDDRAFKQPAAQGSRYNDDCHEKYGWVVCWQMTANDGVEFYDASFRDNLIFSSAKIGQVEVYYPSWPGGYRDEIGYSASVHPYYGTNLTDFGNGFQVSQIFTEFLRWPNCICCYRYEQIMRFYAHGTFELDFISHGPGCDDLSNYRPFWRIDLDIGQTVNDETWYWSDSEWLEAESEVVLPLFEDLSPGGNLLFTRASDKGYLWSPQRTDPLDQDDGRLYVLHYKEGEGDGPIATGPGNTFWPPGKWLDDDSLERENIVLWYIPFLDTKKGDPWWCMPDPEPDFSPCNALLRVEPADELPELPPPQMAPTGEASVPLPSTTTPTPFKTPTPRPIAGEDAEEIMLNSGCGSCHRIGDFGEAGKVGPDLSDIGTVAANRDPDLTAAEYIRQSILDPKAFVATTCPNGPCPGNVMPDDYAQRLSSEQLEILVGYLVNQVNIPKLTGTTEPSPVATATAAATTSDEVIDGEQEPISPASTERSTSVVFVLFLTATIIVLLLLLAGKEEGKS